MSCSSKFGGGGLRIFRFLIFNPLFSLFYQYQSKQELNTGFILYKCLEMFKIKFRWSTRLFTLKKLLKKSKKCYNFFGGFLGFCFEGLVFSCQTLPLLHSLKNAKRTQWGKLSFFSMSLFIPSYFKFCISLSFTVYTLLYLSTWNVSLSVS